MDLDYGNCRALETVEKQTTVFPPLPQRLENSPTAREFPTVPTVTSASTNNEEKPKPPGCFINYSCTSNLNRRLALGLWP